jgi:ribose transport system permease protein
LVILLVLWALLGTLAPGFLSRFNIGSLGRSAAIDIVVGFAQMVVLATGGMNLAVGAIGVCAVMLNGYFLQIVGLPIPVALVLTLGAAALLGLVNGLVISLTNVNSFIVTLATSSLFGGGMLILSRGVPLNNLPPEFGAFGSATLGPVPWLLIVALAVAVGLYVLYANTVFGRQALATGANKRAAKLSGVPVMRVVIGTHCLSGLLAGAAALLLTSRLAAAMPAVAGNDWLLPSFLAPVIGGTALAGGAVSVVGTVLGALLVSTIRSGLLILRVSNFWFQLFLGVFLLAAILIERYRTALSKGEFTR